MNDTKGDIMIRRLAVI